jgi:hypothetical protein
VFAFVFGFFVNALGYSEIAGDFDEVAAVVGLVLITVGGVLHGRSGQGHYGFEDSGMQVELEPVSGSAFMVQLYANRVTVPAYFLTQLFLAGPLQCLKAVACFKSSVKDESGLGARLLALQAEVDARPKRHRISEYPGRERELFLLARMGRIAFSPRKGTVFRKE